MSCCDDCGVKLPSGVTEPAVTCAGLLWWDTENNLIKIRNGANTGWVSIASFDGSVYIPWGAGAVLTGLLDISAPAAGQIKFPATQNPSSDPNTLDDYEEGVWTPEVTFAVPGDLSVAYSTQSGSYTRIGRLVVCHFVLITSSFTHTTASGNFLTTGLPFAPAAGTSPYPNFAEWIGFTFTGAYTQAGPRAQASQTVMIWPLSGSGLPGGAVTAANVPSGGTLNLRSTITYIV